MYTYTLYSVAVSGSSPSDREDDTQVIAHKTTNAAGHHDSSPQSQRETPFTQQATMPAHLSPKEKSLVSPAPSWAWMRNHAFSQ